MTPRSLLRAATHWHIESQLASRRNALVAGTALAARRRERIEVEEFLDRHVRAHLERAEPQQLTTVV